MGNRNTCVMAKKVWMLRMRAATSTPIAVRVNESMSSSPINVSTSVGE